MTSDSGAAQHELGALLADGLDEVERDLAVVGFTALWDNQARRPEDLLPHRPDARSAAEALASRGRAELDDAGHLVGIHGLTLRPTRHHFSTQKFAHNTWCAFDAIAIPAALGLDADATSDCPTCARPLTIAIRRGSPDPTSPAVLWLPDPPARHLMAEFCSCADLYCSPEHLQHRIDQAPSPGEPTSLALAAAIGRQTWADVAAFSTRP